MKAKQVMMRCTVRPSVFDREYIVSVRAIDGKAIEFVADRESVDLFPASGRSPIREGRVRVWDIGKPNEHSLILVPASGGSDGMILNVPNDQLAS